MKRGRMVCSEHGLDIADYTHTRCLLSDDKQGEEEWGFWVDLAIAGYYRCAENQEMTVVLDFRAYVCPKHTFFL